MRVKFRNAALNLRFEAVLPVNAKDKAMSCTTVRLVFFFPQSSGLLKPPESEPQFGVACIEDSVSESLF